MNHTKWTEIFKAFYYDIECSEDPKLSGMLIHWTTGSTNGFVYNDSTWTHFGSNCMGTKDIEWLKIDLTPENRRIVLDILKRIHVPGEVLEDCVYVYGYRTDVDYIE